MILQTVNPATEKVLATYHTLSDEVINQRLNLGHDAYLRWKHTELSERRKLIHHLADLVRKDKEVLAHQISIEMGKPIKQAEAELDKCVHLCEHYVGYAEQYLAPYFVELGTKRAKVCYTPLGIVLGIMPWNFPFWQVFRFSIPNLIAGNAIVLKHAPISTGSGQRMEALFHRAGFPEHLFQQLIVDNDGVSKIIEHPAVIGISLTGSERAGSAVAAQAGKQLKKTVLELGGSDPYLILDDADIEHAAQDIVTSRLNNAGQVCVSAKRIIVMKSIEDKVIERILAAMSGYIMGDPLDPNVMIGPLARKDLRDNLHVQVEKSVKQGAKLLVGGIIPKKIGFYYPPTLLTHVTPGMPAFDEELFGPVLSICSVTSEQEAIELANSSHYGLGAAVYTSDLARGERIATYELDAGSCFVNGYVVSDPRLPFGGMKRSGYGRELAKEGLLEFVNVKTMVIND
jgi:succinate-semialdehyde dehydrogenase/glutarate-semialdehyde dehydrogenase